VDKPEKELHKHNSIPTYIDDVDEGCSTCIRNKAISDYEAFLPDEGELIKIIEEVDLSYEKDEPRKYNKLAKAISARLKGD